MTSSKIVLHSFAISSCKTNNRHFQVSPLPSNLYKTSQPPTSPYNQTKGKYDQIPHTKAPSQPTYSSKKEYTTIFHLPPHILYKLPIPLSPIPSRMRPTSLYQEEQTRPPYYMRPLKQKLGLFHCLEFI